MVVGVMLTLPPRGVRDTIVYMHTYHLLTPTLTHRTILRIAMALLTIVEAGDSAAGDAHGTIPGLIVHLIPLHSTRYSNTHPFIHLPHHNSYVLPFTLT